MPEIIRPRPILEAYVSDLAFVVVIHTRAADRPKEGDMFELKIAGLPGPGPSGAWKSVIVVSVIAAETINDAVHGVDDVETRLTLREHNDLPF